MAPVPTLETPPYWSNHGDPNLVCIPGRWTSVVVFCLANYLAHCATVKPYPGETIAETITAMVFAFFLPSSGIMRAMDSIIRRPNFRKMNELEKAAMAGALCMVVRDYYWTPGNEELLESDIYVKREVLHTKKVQSIENDTIQTDRQIIDPQSIPFIDQPRSESINAAEEIYDFDIRSPPCMKEKITTCQPNAPISERGCKIHGFHQLPVGYSLSYIPSDAVVLECPERQPGQRPLGYTLGPRQSGVSSSYSFTKAAIAILQTLYASITLYRARGDQLKSYGYAAFGLTVVPYILMSILNLIAQISSPDYPTLYLIHTEIMDEAIRRGGHFEGVIGYLKSGNPLPQIQNRRTGPWKATKHTEDTEATLFPTSSWILRNAQPMGDEQHQEFLIRTRYFGGSRSAKVGWISVPSCEYFATRIERSSSRQPLEWGARRSRWSFRLHFLAPVIFGCISITIVGIISRFHKGNSSTSLQRGFTMAWLVVGMVFGALSIPISKRLREHEYGISDLTKKWLTLLLYGGFLVPAIGGLVVVCRMIIEYGTCTRIP
ncbi:hypothetical protein BCR34DRAFT_566129 [Clohesyomyces aquaticus]|uniref:Uncharacterized protein n=1 Tax=Clohesyomyces aquaticus TaxID=1231657 RepID=A0A1Y1ZKW8_9PLEO|nr:hypothetical protein BCR34DRAFT_566129 [Clohesyomyces aquaticus]